MAFQGLFGVGMSGMDAPGGTERNTIQDRALEVRTGRLGPGLEGYETGGKEGWLGAHLSLIGHGPLITGVTGSDHPGVSRLHSRTLVCAFISVSPRSVWKPLEDKT